MSNSHRFSRTLTAADANNIVLILDLNQKLIEYEQFKPDHIVEHTIILDDFLARSGLFSLLEPTLPKVDVPPALISDEQKEANYDKMVTEGQKVFLEIYIAEGNGPWELQGEEALLNVNSLEKPWPLLAPLFGTKTTATLGENLKLGARIAPKAQGVGGLQGTDYIRLMGSWRKDTQITKKKDDSIESLLTRIEALETLLSLFGAASATLPGSNGLVPAPPAGSAEYLLRGDRTWQNPTAFNFANKADIDSAVLGLIGGAPGVLDTLDELAQALADDANFASTIANNFSIVTNALALKAPSANPSFTGDVNVEGKITQSINYTFRAAAATNQAVANDANNLTKINLTTEVNDSNSQYDPILSRLTAKTNNEVWRISIYISYSLSANTRILLSLLKNNSQSLGLRVLDTVANTGTSGTFLTVPEISLVAGDYIELFTLTTPGSTIVGVNSLVTTYWFGKRIA